MPDLPADATHVPAPARDARISEIFYFFEAHTTVETGRAVGRKIGIVQELMLKKHLEATPELKRRMYLEQLLTGRSGSAHKVEFSWFWIEPRERLSVGDQVLDELEVTAIDSATGTVSVNAGWRRPVRLRQGRKVTRNGRLHEHLMALEKDLRVVALDGETASIDVVDRTRLLASLESKRVGAQRFSNSEKLGSGIQTIEKAKQASLVAIDLDLQHNRNVKPLEAPGTPKSLLSLVALGNGVHWTQKDLQILETYVDYTFLVHDRGIIRYLNYIRDRVGGSTDFLRGFMDYFTGMTKQPDDDFAVSDDDFQILVPAGETRTLRDVLSEHMARVNPI